MKKYSDKIKHFIISCAIVFGVSLILPIWVGIILALAIGFAKELHDQVIDLYDLLADVLGIIMAIIVLRIG